jgi:hypothetical protein
MPRDRVQNVGTISDRKFRTEYKRTERSRTETVHKAQQFIFQKNFAVDSAPVKRILDPQSLVPTSVS